ncbi:MAG TPA: hypothetical protein VNZ55_11335 [Thermomicrobiales bacterium]|nr:hypothetical protein [Thermomicrobiales bacterium]
MRMRANNQRTNQCPTGAAVRSLLIAATVLLLVGCGSGKAPDPTPTPPLAVIATPSPAAISTPATPAALTDVVFATGIDATTGGPSQQVQEMPETTKTIYAFVQSGPLPAGTTVAAEWTIDGTPIPGVSQSVQVNHAREAGWIEFHLVWTAEGTWPRGVLGITISVDGKPFSSGSVRIVQA